MRPTREQQEVIQHVTGNALILAVAGSGKTSTLIRRARYLISEHTVPPERVLITTFSKSAKADLERRCQEANVVGLEIRTLHSLATIVVNEAKRLGLTHLAIGPDGFSRRLFEQCRNELLETFPPTDRQQIADLRQMNFTDFSSFIAIEKGRLHLPYLPDGLTDEARAKVKIIAATTIYEKMYHRHDETRRREGYLDHDDVIVAAWTLMQMYPVLRDLIHGRYWHVMVDEYQDVSTAQAEMLATLVDGLHSYMVAGDDDQAIYGWRGADPNQILNFPSRFGGVCYRLSLNFRSPAGIVVLAQRVIEENTVRAEKSMLPTRPGNGVAVHGTATPVDVIAATLAEGVQAGDIAVLLRTYAQTPEIEQALLERGIPYQIIGEAPFFLRPEARTLLNYIIIALADWDVENRRPVSDERRRRLGNTWRSIANRPGRYFRTTHIEQIAERAWSGDRSLAQALAEAAPTWPTHIREPAIELEAALRYLKENIGNYPGKNILMQFAGAIGYADFLIRSAPTIEFGRERADVIGALAEMAQSRSLGELITHVAELERQVSYQEQYRREESDTTPKITLMTVYKAKGLQWPVVLIPNCTTDVYKLKCGEQVIDSEEERRVYYVALTRATSEVHLLTEGGRTTRFLTDVDYERIVSDHSRFAHLLEGAREKAWSAVDTLTAAEIIATYHHLPLVKEWLEPEQCRTVLGRIAGLEDRLYRLGTEVPDSLFMPWVTDLTEEESVFDDIDEVLLPKQESPVLDAPEKIDALGRTRSMTTTYQVGDRVRHASYGDGEILAVERIGDGQVVQVRFAEGNRRMATQFTILELLEK